MSIMIDLPPAMAQEAREYATVQGTTLERMLLDCIKAEMERRRATRRGGPRVVIGARQRIGRRPAVCRAIPVRLGEALQSAWRQTTVRSRHANCEATPDGLEMPLKSARRQTTVRSRHADCKAIPDGFGMAMQSARRQTTVSECPCKLQEDFETLPKAQFLRFDTKTANLRLTA